LPPETKAGFAADFGFGAVRGLAEVPELLLVTAPSQRIEHRNTAASRGIFFNP
jgi:hypothetical protein